jgi:hypothetical protein
MSNITFSVENYNTLLNDGASLFKGHWEEIAMYKGSRPLNINHAGFFQAESQGKLAVFTVRSDNNLVGYAVFTFGMSTHYSIPVTSNDAFYLHPQFRKGWTAVKFIKYCLKMLKQSKAKQIIWRTKSYQSFGPILERYGMREDDVCYSMMLDGENDNG